jgi:pentatricopeptide repeat protein
MKPPPRLPLFLLRRRHLSSSISDSAASELARALAAAPSQESTRNLAAVLRRLGVRGLASALSSLPASLPAASAQRLLQHVLSADAASEHSCCDDLLSPHISALLLASLVAVRAALPSAQSLLSRLLHAQPLSVAAAAIADAASAISSDFLVRAYLDSPGPGSLCRAADAFHELCSRGASPSIVTCNILVEALVRAGRLDAAIKVFDQMRSGKSVSPDGYTYTSMIKVLCRAGDVNSAFDMLAELQGTGLQLTVVPYNVLMGALFKSGRVKEAFRLKGRMVEGRVRLTVVTFGILINGLARSERFVEVSAVLREMEGLGITPNEVIYNELIGWHCRKRHCSKVLRLFDEMVSKGNETDSCDIQLDCKCSMQGR